MKDDTSTKIDINDESSTEVMYLLLFQFNENFTFFSKNNNNNN